MHFRLRTLTCVALTALALTSAGSSASASTALVNPGEVSNYAQPYTLNGHPISAGFVPYASEVVAGEPILVTFVITNTGTVSIDIPRFSPRGMDMTCKISITRASGEQIKPLEFNSSGGIGWRSELPAGESFFHTIFISDYFPPLPEGSYTVRLVKGDHCSYPGEANLPDMPTEFALRVLPADPARLGKVIKDLGAIIESSSDQTPLDKNRFKSDLASATKALGFIDDQRIVPYLLKSLGKGDYTNRGPALGALSKHPSAELVEPIAKELGNPRDNALRRSAATALASFKYPEAVSALVGALKDQDEYVRRSVVASLGSIGDRSATKSVKPMLSDSSNVVVLAAIEALVKLGEKPKLSWFDPLFADTSRKPYSFDGAVWAISHLLGEDGLPYLADKFDLNDPGKKNYRNYLLMNRISDLSRERFTYLHDFDENGTPEEQEQNMAVMREVQKRFIK